MSRLSLSQVLARANATLVQPDLDATGALASLLAGAVEALPADGAAILVEVDGVLEVLASTSHATDVLEAFQSQVDQGPCLDAIRSGQDVQAVGLEELSARWPLAGQAFVTAGFAAVQATTLRWRGQTFGALNLFRSRAEGFDTVHAECRAMADAVTLILVSSHLDGPDIATGLRAALEERAVVEQAKGALAEVYELDMAAAFEMLLERARADNATLGVAARQVMERARTKRLAGADETP